VLALPAWALVRNWLLVPAALALVFAAASLAVWLVLQAADHGSPARALVTLLACAIAGTVALCLTVVISRAREYELVRSALRNRAVRRAVTA
jgi:Zn-dependent protease with chaperone function